MITEEAAAIQPEAGEAEVISKIQESLRHGYKKCDQNTGQISNILILSRGNNQYRCEMTRHKISGELNRGFILTVSDQNPLAENKKRVLTVIHTSPNDPELAPPENSIQYSVVKEENNIQLASQPMPLDERDPFLKEISASLIDLSATNQEFLALRNDPKNKPPTTMAPIIFLPPTIDN